MFVFCHCYVYSSAHSSSTTWFLNSVAVGAEAYPSWHPEQVASSLLCTWICKMSCKHPKMCFPSLSVSIFKKNHVMSYAAKVNVRGNPICNYDLMFPKHYSSHMLSIMIFPFLLTHTQTTNVTECHIIKTLTPRIITNGIIITCHIQILLWFKWKGVKKTENWRMTIWEVWLIVTDMRIGIDLFVTKQHKTNSCSQ